MTQFSDHVRTRLILRLIENILSVLEKLLRYFHGTTIFRFTAPLLSVLFKNLNLNLKDLESVMSSTGISLQYCHKLAMFY